MTASETRPHVHKQNDLAVSSRIIDFNVQINAVNIQYHCSKMTGKN